MTDEEIEEELEELVELDELDEATKEALLDSTDSPDQRHWLTNDGMAWAIVLSFIGIIIFMGTGYIDPSLIPEWLVLALVAGFASVVVWAYGVDMFEALLGRK